ncbi:MAG: hypothetical protein WDO17_16945 [Alphaproteobacteria bacterium]
MKRSENVSLVVMGVAAFAATFGGGLAYSAWQKPSSAAQAQTAMAADQQCATRSDGTRNCEPQRRGFTYYLFPRWGSSTSEPVRREAALVGNSRSGVVAVSNNGVQRSGFGSTGSSPSIRVSAGG